MLTSHVMSIVSGVAYVGAYAAITIFSHFVEEHRDLCPFYAMVTVAAALHVTIVTVHTWSEKK